MSHSVRVRFAPSPTGLLHIGGLRTALYNFLYARHHNGVFILRIEDTDQNRYVEGAEEDIVRSLTWAGMDYDEGPDKPGKVGPYRQSERSDIYKIYADKLIENGQAYYAFDTEEEINDMRERLKKSGNPSPKYDAITRMSMKNSLTLPKDEVESRISSGAPFVVRLKVPRRETIRFEDEIRGFVSFESHGLDDQVLLKSDGLPTYHLANVVDDHMMGVTNVIRGEEWLSSAPKHILLYQYLGWEMPKMAHLPLIMSPSGGKLSKRNADKLGIPVNVRDYINLQYEPDALVNFLAYLGWSPGDNREVMSSDEMIKDFSLDRVSKSGAVFNPKKLLWYNEQYLRAKPDESLVAKVRELAESHGYKGFSDVYLKTVIRLMKDRAQLVEEFVTQAPYFFERPGAYDENTVRKAWKNNSGKLVLAYMKALRDMDANLWNGHELKEVFKKVIEEKEVGFGKLAQPARLAVSGMGFGPELFDMMELIGREETLERLKKAVDELG